MKTLIVKLLFAALVAPASMIVHAQSVVPEAGIPINDPTPIVQPAQTTDFKPLEPLPEPDIVQAAPIPEKPAVANPVQSGWHYECRSQAAAVQAEVERQGLGGDWVYIQYIFSHESCIDPGRLNSEGCGGLGQACPTSKLGCGADDIPCQVAWFNRYAQGKGGWQAAYNLWLRQHWW